MKPCKRGHSGGRYANGGCIECAAMRKGRKNRTVPPTRLDRLAAKTIAMVAEEAKLRREQARIERKRIKKESRERENAEYKAHWAAKDAERAAMLVAQSRKPTKSPSLNIETVAARSVQAALEATARYERRDVPPEPEKPEATLPPSKRAGMPVWVREGRSATREEWLAHQAMRCGGPPRQTAGARGYRESGSELVPAPSIEHDTGVDFNARPDGSRVPVDDDSRNGWRNGGPNWTKRL